MFIPTILQHKLTITQASGTAHMINWHHLHNVCVHEQNAASKHVISVNPLVVGNQLPHD
jgi:hypothetical protein